MEYLEPLPDGCPPETADTIDTERRVYRLVRTNTVTMNDFRSQRAEHPDKVFAVPECQARGLSVFAERGDSANARKLPGLKQRLICKVVLESGAGRILQTGRPSHHTWWPFAGYDIVAHCTVEES